jgi:hypothetical protein
MNLEEFYCKEFGLINVDEYFHILKSQTEHKGNCTKENHPCLKCEFEELVNKFLVYKFGLVGFKLSINCPWSSEVCHSCFFQHDNLNFYVDWYDAAPDKLLVMAYIARTEDISKPQYCKFGQIDTIILDILQFINMIKSAEDEYDELIRPINLFKSNEEVKRFVKIRLLSKEAHIQSLRNMLQLCIEDECFEWCRTIKLEIDRLTFNRENILIPNL